MESSLEAIGVFTVDSLFDRQSIYSGPVVFSAIKADKYRSRSAFIVAPRDRDHLKSLQLIWEE